MGGIFLSYRRGDGDVAVLLYAWLAEKFGRSQVFWDREDIKAGTEFAAEISDRLSSCNALIALIGRRWTPSEWVRREIALAFRRKIIVLPILTSDISSLPQKGLTRGIRKLATIQHLETRDLRFRDQLIDILQAVVLPRRDSNPQSHAQTQRFQDLMHRQVNNLQSRALELLKLGQPERAIVELQEGFEFIMALLEFSPGDLELEVQLGYLYKNLAQSFPDTRHRNRYARLSLSVFERFQDSPDVNVRASALNGLGNIFLILDKPSKAAEYIRGALAIAPDYGYAWNDLFAAQAALAERGKLDLEEMREALKQMKRYWADDVLKALYIKDCVRTLRSWERGARKGLPKNITTRR